MYVLLKWQFELILLFASDVVLNYSKHPKAGPSGFQMVISQTLFVSGIQMAFETRSGFFSASLDRFGMNKIFFYDTFLYKTV
jgi:hypothetical protein